MKISSVVFALLTRALLGGRKKFILLHTRVDAVENKCFRPFFRQVYAEKTSEKQSGCWGDGWWDEEKSFIKLTHCQPSAAVSAAVIAGCAGKKIPSLSQLHGFAEMRGILQSEKWWFSSECLKVKQSSPNSLLHFNGDPLKHIITFKQPDASKSTLKQHFSATQLCFPAIILSNSNKWKTKV